MSSGTYEFGGKKYTQTKLVWGQVKQLNAVIKGVQFPSSGLTVPMIIELLGEKVPLVVAIILAEEGIPLKDKNLDALAAEFEFDLPLEVVVQVFEDFFDCNPIISVLEKLTVGMQALRKKIEAAGVKISTTPLPSSPGETSQSGTS